MTKTPRPPWKRPNPRKRAGKASRHLSPAKKAAAKASARRAGRPWPNLVDNMRMASKKASTRKKPAKKKRAVRKRAAHKKAATKASGKRSAKAREKDPRGDLTAAGRSAFAKKDGSHLKPGVRKRASEDASRDAPQRQLGGTVLWPRQTAAAHRSKGRPDRHALSAHAWGEPVPKTVAAARRIATRGERLLARYRRTKKKG